MKKIILFIIYICFFNSSANALVQVDITRGNLDPLPIAVSPLYIEPGSKDIKYKDDVIKNVGEKMWAKRFGRKFLGFARENLCGRICTGEFGRENLGERIWAEEFKLEN